MTGRLGLSDGRSRLAFILAGRLIADTVIGPRWPTEEGRQAAFRHLSTVWDSAISQGLPSEVMMIVLQLVHALLVDVGEHTGERPDEVLRRLTSTGDPPAPA